jgi:hypothetical protein
MDNEQISSVEWHKGNRSTRRKTCPSANLSAISPTWTGLEMNPGLRDDRPVTNRLSHCTPPVFRVLRKRRHINDSRPSFSALLSPDFNQTWIFTTRFSKQDTRILHENPSSNKEVLHACGQADITTCLFSDILGMCLIRTADVTEVLLSGLVGKTSRSINTQRSLYAQHTKNS